MCKTLVQAVIEHGKLIPNKTAIGFSKRLISYEELSDAVKKCAFTLQNEFGISAGNKLLITATSSPEYITVFLAIQYLGAVTVPIDRNEREEEIFRLCDFIKPSLLITDLRFLEDFENQRAKIKLASLKELYEKSLCQDVKEFSSVFTPSDDSVIEMIFTTGTTSAPKCAMHTVKSINAIMQNTINGTGILKDDTVLNPLPLNHSAGLRVLRSTLYLGATVVLQNGFTFAHTLETNIAEFKCTTLVCVPASIELLRMQMQESFKQVLGSLRLIEVAAGMLLPKSRRELTLLLPDTTIINTWGSTETGGTIFWTSKMQEKMESLGKPADGVLAKTIDSDGNDVKASDSSSAGRLCLCGDMKMKGYFENPSATELVLKDGWLVTNDLVFCDSDGFLYMLGRADDIINVGGEKISPVEVENAASQFEKLVECACIGVDDPDGIYGQISVLYAVFEKGFSDLKGFEQFLSDRLQRFKVPNKFIQIDSLPRNRMQKIDRNALRRLWNESIFEKSNKKIDVIAAIKTRQSIREFTDQEIPYGTLKNIVECGCFAPTGHNMQTWRFTVITDKKRITQLKELTQNVSKEKGIYFYGFVNPAAVVVVSNDRRNETGVQDSSAASQNIMLAAHSFGLGSVWVNALFHICDEEKIRAFLTSMDIPKTHSVIATICMGYPKEIGKQVPRKQNVIKWL